MRPATESITADLALACIAGMLAAATVLAGLPSASPAPTAEPAPTPPPARTAVDRTPPSTARPESSATPRPTPAPGPALGELVGQKLMVAMAGTAPSSALLDRVRRGEVGGVILFGDNISDPAQLRALTSRLQAAARAGGQPRLLIATDQEGGAIRRVPWIGPMAPASKLAALAASAVGAEARATGAGLQVCGINDDLAPVADVPGSAASFLVEQARTWSFSAATSSTLANAFATGLESAGNLPTMKHFPGLGLATANTDLEVVTIAASNAALAPGLLPYRTAIARGIPMIMLSNATYPSQDPTNAAGWSHAIGTDLLRGQLGFRGVTITDSLNGAAKARGVSASSLAVKAAKAGTDMILLTGSEASTAAAYATLLRAAGAGQLSRSSLEASYRRIVALKSRITLPVSGEAC